MRFFQVFDTLCGYKDEFSDAKHKESDDLKIGQQACCGHVHLEGLKNSTLQVLYSYQTQSICVHLMRPFPVGESLKFDSLLITHTLEPTL